MASTLSWLGCRCVSSRQPFLHAIPTGELAAPAGSVLLGTMPLIGGYLCEKRGLPCHSSQFVLVSLYWRALAPSQWRKVCRITVLTRPRIQTATANRQAVPNRQACRAMGTALTRLSQTSIAVTTGIGITVTGIDESGGRAEPVGCRAPLRSMGRFRSEPSIEHRVIRATTCDATPALVVGLLRTSGCRPTIHGSPFPYVRGRNASLEP